MCVGVGGTTISNILANTAADQLGASNFTASMAGDAYLPAALGSLGTDTVPMGSKLGEKFSAEGSKKIARLLGSGLLAQQANQANRRPPPQPMQPPPPGPNMSGIDSVKIAFPGEYTAKAPYSPLAELLRGIDLKDPKSAALLEQLMKQQGGLG